jgi:hypothetical protein
MRTNEQGHPSVKQARSSRGAEDAGPIAFFRAAYQAFQRAEQAVRGPVDRFYRIGGYPIRLRFAGPALIPFITPALEHLAAKPNPAPALTICLWDSALTRTKMPPCPWATDDYIARGEVCGYNDEHIHTAFYLGSGLNEALFWIRDAGLTPYYETSAPLRAILHWWMRDHERQFVHAAAVGTPKGGVLLAGKGGSGKSTTALTCLSSGLLYAGDDYVLLSRQPTPFVYSLYSVAKLDAGDMQKLPHLLPAAGNFERLDMEKALLFLHDHYPDRITMGFPVQAILLPRITGFSETKLKKASPAASLAALAPSTIFQLPGAGREVFQNLADFVKRVQGYILELGTDLTRIPEVVLSLLSGD